MLKRLFVFMLVVVVLYLVEYSVFQLQNTSVLIVTMGLLNQSELTRNSNQVLKSLFSNILTSHQGEGELEMEIDPPVGETGRKQPSPLESPVI